MDVSFLLSVKCANRRKKLGKYAVFEIFLLSLPSQAGTYGVITEDYD